MALETGTFVGDLNATNPTSTDPKSQGDDHLRLLKTVLKNTFAGFSGMVIVTGTEAQGATASDYTVTVSPAPADYTASMLVVFKATHTNTGAATVQVNGLGTKPLLDVNGNPLAAGMIGNGALCISYYDGASFYAVSANGLQTAPTPATGDSSSKLATTQFVARDFAPLASAALTGTPTCPTPAPVTSKQIVNAEFVLSVAYAAVTLPIMQGQTLTADTQSMMGTACYRSEYFNAAANSMFILPDARTLNIGLCFEIYSVNAAQLMANDGSYIGSSNVPAGLSRLWLIDNSTQAGTWLVSPAVSMTQLNKTTLTGGTVTVTSSLSNANPQIKTVQLDATRTLLIYGTARNASATSGVWAVVASCAYTQYGRPTVTVGTPVQISGGANIGTDALANFLSVTTVDTEKFAVAWMESTSTPTTTPKVAVITTSGTTVTVGAPISLHAAYTGSLAAVNAPAIGISSHSTGAFIAGYYDATTKNVYASVCTVSGTTITQGTEYTVKTLLSNATYSPALMVVAHSSTLVCFGFAYDVGTGNSVHIVAANIVGSALGIGTSVSAGVSGSVPGVYAMSKLSSTTGVMLTGAFNVVAYSVSAPNTVSVGAGVAAGTSKALGVVSSSQVLALGGTAAYNFSISGTSVSAGSPASFSASSNVGPYCDEGRINGTAMVLPDNIIDISTVSRRGSLDSTSTYVASATASNRYSLSAWISGGTTLNTRAILPAYAVN